jgi:hypothetical protein
MASKPSIVDVQERVLELIARLYSDHFVWLDDDTTDEQIISVQGIEGILLIKMDTNLNFEDAESKQALLKRAKQRMRDVTRQAKGV